MALLRGQPSDREDFSCAGRLPIPSHEIVVPNSVVDADNSLGWRTSFRDQHMCECIRYRDDVRRRSESPGVHSAANRSPRSEFDLFSKVCLHAGGTTCERSVDGHPAADAVDNVGPRGAQVTPEPIGGCGIPRRWVGSEDDDIDPSLTQFSDSIRCVIEATDLKRADHWPHANRLNYDFARAPTPVEPRYYDCHASPRQPLSCRTGYRLIRL